MQTRDSRGLRDQHYALNAQQEFVWIGDATKKEKYYCLSCGQEMIVKKGKVRQWHYAHKNTNSCCSYETYLHRLAKEKISKWIIRQSNLYLHILTPYYCSRKDLCQWSDDYSCSWDDYKSYDLKKYYNACDIEQSYRGFRADILLFNNLDKYPPIFIEICVTHLCDDEKIKSDIKIVEILVEQESDIENCIKQNFIIESEKIRLYNFARRILPGRPKDPKPLWKYTLFDNDKMYCKSTNCLDYTARGEHVKYEVVYELKDYWCFDFSSYEYGAMMAEKRFPSLRTCNLCKYHAMRDPLDFDLAETSIKEPIVCRLYKKYGTPRFCQDQVAQHCKYYRKIDKSRQEDLKQQVLSYEIWSKDV